MLQDLYLVILCAQGVGSLTDLCHLPHLKVLLCENHVEKSELGLLDFVNFICHVDGLNNIHHFVNVDLTLHVASIDKDSPGVDCSTSKCAFTDLNSDQVRHIVRELLTGKQDSG